MNVKQVKTVMIIGLTVFVVCNIIIGNPQSTKKKQRNQNHGKVSFLELLVVGFHNLKAILFCHCM